MNTTVGQSKGQKIQKINHFFLLKLRILLAKLGHQKIKQLTWFQTPKNH